MRVPARFDASALGLWALAALVAAALAWAGYERDADPPPAASTAGDAAEPAWIELTPLPAPSPAPGDARAATGPD